MIIAEFSNNHLGDLSVIRDMVAAAADAGAKFAKIQTHFVEDLSNYWRTKDLDAVKRVESCQLDFKAHEKFVEHCKEYGIKPMTSVYTDKYADVLKDLGFEYIKIGSAECTNQELIKSYIDSGFKVTISTGGTYLQYISKVSGLYGALHCVSKYPSLVSDANLSRIDLVRKHLSPRYVGLSCHMARRDPFCLVPSMIALTMGSKLIEKHFSLLPEEKTKDGPVSITLSQLKRLCAFERMSVEERLDRYPELGIYFRPPDDHKVIEEYRKRWLT